MATSSNGPTPDQIKKVQTNLTNMQAFNDHVYSFGQAKYLNAYFLLSEHDDNDLGLAIGLNIIEGAFWAAGSVAGPAGSFLASFLSGMVAYWMTDTPPSLNTAFAQNVLRFQATTEQVDANLATYFQDVPGNWDQSFSYNGKTQAVSDLATFDFPTETDEGWKPLMDATLLGVDQTLWNNLLVAGFVITFWYDGGDGTWNGSDLFTEYREKDIPPTDWVRGFYKQHPAYYEDLAWYSGDPKNCCASPPCWAVGENNLGTGVGPLGFTDGSISDDAANYLFIDSTPGAIINPNGLFKREDVFKTLGIKTVTYYVQNNPGPPMAGARAANISLEYVRAIKPGQTLGQLLAREGRAQIEQRILEQAKNDPVFHHDLRKRPRMTLEKFLGVKIPEVITLNVWQEFPWSFGLVLPAQTSNQLPQGPAGASTSGGLTASPASALEHLDRFFTTAPSAVETAAAKITAVYQITVSPPDQAEWVLRVENGKVVGQKGRVEQPDVTLEASASDWLDITTGKVDSLVAFFLGKLAVTGNFILARKLRDILPPTPVKN
jgi:SCP-2 sterol transfer family protein